jgi:sugar-specific transcriptional regulator TrmB
MCTILVHIMTTQHLLQALGLTKSESTLYLTLLKQGPLTLAELARLAKIHRPAAYKDIPHLIKKNLVSTTSKGRRTYFHAESPEQLSRFLSETQSSLSETLPSLIEMYNKKSNAPRVRFLEGKTAIASVYDDIIETLNTGDVFYRYSSAANNRRRGSYVPQNYEARRDAKRLERYVITNTRTAEQKKQKLERYIKVVPAQFDLFEQNITQLIYANRIAYVDYNTDTAVIIENKIIAEFQKRLFQLLFSKL